MHKKYYYVFSGVMNGQRQTFSYRLILVPLGAVNRAVRYCVPYKQTNSIKGAREGNMRKLLLI